VGFAAKAAASPGLAELSGYTFLESNRAETGGDASSVMSCAMLRYEAKAARAAVQHSRRMCL
jgi:hypothetical protein